MPAIPKRQIGREPDRLELLLEQIKAVEAERDAVLAAAQAVSPAPAMLLDLKGIGRNLPPCSDFEGPGMKGCTGVCWRCRPRGEGNRVALPT